MKGLNKWMMLLLAGVLLVGFASCSKDDDEGATIEESALQGTWKKVVPTESTIGKLGDKYQVYDYYEFSGKTLKMYRPAAVGDEWAIPTEATIEIDGDLVFYKLVGTSELLPLGRVSEEGEGKLLVTVDSRVLEAAVAKRTGKETKSNTWKDALQNVGDYLVNSKFYLEKATRPDKPEKKAESEE